MTEISASAVIPGVKQVQFRRFGDERGQFMETFRKAWFPERTWDIVQANRSISKAGVLRGLHYHHHQVDYWQVVAGTIRVGLADLRRSSPAFRRTQVVELSAAEPGGLFIPVGVAHGFLALEDATLMYLVDNYYDGGDELGVAWNDPDLAILWGIDSPLLSDRDRANPRLASIALDALPA